jgi:hypothetical protein
MDAKVSIHKGARATMASKIHINLAQGILDIEGDEEFVKSIYESLLDQVVAQFGNGKIADQSAAAADVQADDEQDVDAPNPVQKTSRKRASSKRASSEGTLKAAYSPKIVADLDTTGVSQFFAQYIPKTNSDKILIFAKFLESKGANNCSADDIYTCFIAAKQRVPMAYKQSLYHARGRTNAFIKFQSIDEISVTHIGSNHFNHDLQRTGDNK